ncbi:MAG: nodulation protein NfeD [Bacteroidetes bacterium]|jgi:membrane-bound serine protease (ClpP class)|nr:nodulation protein NfeD [Bacteroidota bacterium]
MYKDYNQQNKLGKILILTLISLWFISADTLDNTETQTEIENDKTIVYTFPIKQDIVPSALRFTQRAFEEAQQLKADYIIIHMNTYGGMVNIADSIRTKILNSTIPIFVFIDNNAASAGALISIACDSIYIRSGGNIGAATVVNQTGEEMPDKYQSYMRSTMRSTAESHGADTIIQGNDTIIKWHRDPKIAEAMVDASVEIPGISEKGKVLTFTAREALENGYAEGIAENISEVLDLAQIEDYELKKYEVSGLDRVIAFLMSPVLQGVLIMIILGGIYFELQSPGIGFPIGAAALAAVLYFAPLYLEGLAENWELLLFFAGIVLLVVEIFVIPGFGVAGIAGVFFMIAGLTMAMIDNIVFELDLGLAINMLIRSLLIVVGSLFTSILLAIVFSKQAFRFSGLNMVLNSTQEKEEGYTTSDNTYKQLLGKTGVAYTVLRPSGKVEIEDDIYYATAEIGYIDKGDKVKVTRYSTSQIFVIKQSE